MRKAPDPERSVKIANLPFKDRIPVDIIVYDQKNDEKANHPGMVRSGQSTTTDVPMGDLLDQGIVKFLVLVANTQSQEAMEFYYTYTGGRFVRE